MWTQASWQNDGERRAERRRIDAAGAKAQLFNLLQFAWWCLAVWTALMPLLWFVCMPLLWLPLAILWAFITAKAVAWQRRFDEAYGRTPIRGLWLLYLNNGLQVLGFPFFWGGWAGLSFGGPFGQRLLAALFVFVAALTVPAVCATVYVLLLAVWRVTGEELLRRQLRDIERLFLFLNAVFFFLVILALVYEVLGGLQGYAQMELRADARVVGVFVFATIVIGIWTWIKVLQAIGTCCDMPPDQDEYDRILDNASRRPPGYNSFGRFAALPADRDEDE